LAVEKYAFFPGSPFGRGGKKILTKSEKYADGFPGHAAGVRKIFPFF
jgi:hypothetical protein